MQRLLQNQKMVDDWHEGWRGGAKKFKFPISQSLVRGSSQQRCGFKPSSTRSGSGPLNKCYRGLFHFMGLMFHPCFNALLPCISCPFCAGRFRGGSYDDHCAYHRCQMTDSQTTIIWREGIGSLNQDTVLDLKRRHARTCPKMTDFCLKA